LSALPLSRRGCTHLPLTLCVLLLPTMAGAADLAVVKSEAFAENPPATRVIAAAAVPDGGFVVIARKAAAGSYLIRVSKQGRAEGESSQHDAMGLSISAAGVSADRSVWIAGIAKAADAEKGRYHHSTQIDQLYDFVQRFDEKGNPSAAIPADEPGEEHFVTCAAEVAKGYVLAGSTTVDRSDVAGSNPWLAMIDKSGHLLWERAFRDDHGQTVVIADSTSHRCTGLYASDDGHITMANRVLIAPRVDSSAVWQRVYKLAFESTLVVQVDSDGRELHRLRHDATVAALMVGAKGQVWLVERLVAKRPPIPGDYQRMSIEEVSKWVWGLQSLSDFRLRVHRLDPALREMGLPVVLDHPGNFQHGFEDPHAAYPTPQGGLLLAGCEANGGFTYATYVTSFGTASPVREVGQEVPRCGYLQFSAGGRSGEALLINANDGLGNRVVTLAYSN
jgi:hypothetical protein